MDANPSRLEYLDHPSTNFPKSADKHSDAGMIHSQLIAPSLGPNYACTILIAKQNQIDEVDYRSDASGNRQTERAANLALFAIGSVLLGLRTIILSFKVSLVLV